MRSQSTVFADLVESDDIRSIRENARVCSFITPFIRDITLHTYGAFDVGDFYFRNGESRNYLDVRFTYPISIEHAYNVNLLSSFTVRPHN